MHFISNPLLPPLPRPLQNKKYILERYQKFLYQFFFVLRIFCAPKRNTGTSTNFHRHFLMAPGEGPKADTKIFCAPDISSNFHRHFVCGATCRS
jgi:hypothetical protein